MRLGNASPAYEFPATDTGKTVFLELLGARIDAGNARNRSEQQNQ
jgi:hypothetical protein